MSEVQKPTDGDEIEGEPIDGPLPLTPREALFVAAFADPESDTFGKPTASAAAAGYIEPRNAAWKLRKRPRIIAKLEEYQAVLKATLGKVQSDLEHTRLQALEKGDLATAARCSQLQGASVGMFIDRVAVELPDDVRNMTPAQAAAADIAARLAIEDYVRRLQGPPVDLVEPGHPALLEPTGRASG